MPGEGDTEMMELLINKFTAAMTEKQTKVKEPNTYDGTRDALVIDGWIRSVERYINFHGWSPERSFQFATTLLRDRADAWFRTIEGTPTENGQISDDAPTTWLELKRLLIEFFRPDNSVRLARDKMAMLSQTGDLVTYINTFMDIKLAIPTMTDEEASDKFVRGLNSKQMRAHCRQYEAVTLKDAIHAALAFESAQQEQDIHVGGSSHVNGNNRQRMDDPMDLDVAEFRKIQKFNSASRNNSYARSEPRDGYTVPQ